MGIKKYKYPLFLFSLLAFLVVGIFFRMKAANDTFWIDTSGSVHIRWHLSGFTYAEYLLGLSPTGTLMERVTIENAFPFTSILSFTSNFKFAVAKKCNFISNCEKPNATEISDLEKNLNVGRIIGKMVTNKFSDPPTKTNQQRTPVADF